MGIGVRKYDFGRSFCRQTVATLWFFRPKLQVLPVVPFWYAGYLFLVFGQLSPKFACMPGYVFISEGVRVCLAGDRFHGRRFAERLDREIND
jgi:hypothetical protein